LSRPGLLRQIELTLVRFLLDPSLNTEEGDEGGRRHHPRHDQEDGSGGVREVESNEVGDRSGCAAGLRLRDALRLGCGLSGGQPLGDEGAGYPRAQLGDQDRSQNGSAAIPEQTNGRGD